MSGTVPYLGVQSAFDAIVPFCIRSYMKSHFMNELTDEAIAASLECDARRPNPETLIVIRTLGGAIARGRVRAQRVPAPLGALQPQHRPTVV